MPNVGDTVWIFDENRRVYNKERSEYSFNAPIWREHWRPEEIVSETTRSWITKWGTKISKKDPGVLVIFSEEELDNRSWINDNKYEIVDKIRYGNLDYDTLKAIDDLIEQKEQKSD
jgi:hypothetical protein